MSPLHLSNPFRRDPETPTLKERGAALKAGLARIARRPNPAPAPTPAGPPPDLATACDWAIEHMAWINGDPDPWSDERLETEVARFDAVLDRAAGEPSNGPGDLAAKARLLMCEWRTLVGAERQTPGERALASLLREVGALSPAAVSPLYQDAAGEGRVLAAGGIDHHDGTMSYCAANGAVVRQPVARWVAFTAAQMHSKVQAEIGRQRVAANALPIGEYEAWEAQVRRDLRADAVFALAVRSDLVFEAAEAQRQGTGPSTAETGYPDLSNPGALAAAIMDGWRAWSATLGKPEGNPETDAAYERACDRRDELLDVADALPATPGHLAVKALALAWLEYVAIWDRSYQRADYSTDGRLVLDIHAAITADPASSSPVAPAPHPDINLVDRLDLASATMEDLQALHDVADMVSGVAYAATWQRRCKARGPGGLYNVAGTLMQDLADALTDVEGAAAREAKRRTPGSGNDREARLKLIAPMIIQNGDPDEVAELARELTEHATATWGAR